MILACERSELTHIDHAGLCKLQNCDTILLIKSKLIWWHLSTRLIWFTMRSFSFVGTNSASHLETKIAWMVGDFDLLV
jgi:hypothetical protein